MPGKTSCLCTPLKITCLADWLISLKTKTRPAPAYAAGFAPRGGRRSHALRKGHQGIRVYGRCCREARAPGSPSVAPFP